MGVFTWEHFYVDCVCQMSLVWGIWCGCLPSLSSGCADFYHLCSSCGWCWQIYSLFWVWGRTSSLLSGSLQLPCQGGVCSQVVGAEALRVGLKLALFPLSVCFSFSHTEAFTAKEESAEISGACVLIESSCAACEGVWGFAQTQPKFISFPLLWLSQI